MATKKKITNKMQREGQMYVDPHALTLRDLAVLERQLSHMPRAKIMEELHLTHDQFDGITKKARYKAKVEALRQERLKNIEQITSDEQFIRSHAREAAIRDIHLMRNGKSETIQQKSIFDILDRSKVGTPTESVGKGIQVGVQVVFSNEISKGDPDLLRVLTRLTENTEPEEAQYEESEEKG